MKATVNPDGLNWAQRVVILLILRPLKARAVAGDIEAGERWLESLRPFVYRRYLDFSAIEALRTMKQLIQQEVRRKGMADNIKLGSGGIREVEFIAQAFQLICLLDRGEMLAALIEHVQRQGSQSALRGVLGCAGLEPQYQIHDR